VQFQEDVRTIKHKSWVIRYNVIPNPRWQTATILKIENNDCILSNLFWLPPCKIHQNWSRFAKVIDRSLLPLFMLRRV